jgi:signal peptidase II
MRTNDTLRNGCLSLLLILVILVIDQLIKIEVKTHFSLGESVRVTNWFYLSFVENNGMAYGMTFFNKIVLSMFRIIALLAIGWYMCQVVRRKHSVGYLVVLSMIFAGAAGNILDSMFYGLIFDASSPYTVSQFVPFGTGYASFLHGKVVDMFYFPLIVTTYPDWMPWEGGGEVVFFAPVFNFADACISVGIVIFFLFYRHEMEDISASFKGYFKKKSHDKHA